MAATKPKYARLETALEVFGGGFLVLGISMGVVFIAGGDSKSGLGLALGLITISVGLFMFLISLTCVAVIRLLKSLNDKY
jgi:membrane protein implicated in regulation of membrane protease activity